MVEEAPGRLEQLEEEIRLAMVERDICYGVFATDAGLAAIGIGEAENAAPNPQQNRPARQRPPRSLCCSNATRARRLPN